MLAKTNTASIDSASGTTPKRTKAATHQPSNAAKADATPKPRVDPSGAVGAQPAIDRRPNPDATRTPDQPFLPTARSGRPAAPPLGTLLDDAGC